MITGSVSEGLDLLVTIEVSDRNGVHQPLEVILDTGFNGDLTLPRDMVQHLGLTYRGQTPWTLASGKEVMMSNYDGEVFWHGLLREVQVVETDGDPLLGMALLIGSKITVDARIGGQVLIEDNPATE